jgi:4-amino-4-deoxy-L-arabinose transferase-like glycosyltransferase
LAPRQTWLLALLLFAAALALRLPYLQLAPRYEDEGLEVLWALEIARGRRPLTGCDAYYGPLFSYMVAVPLRVFGVNIFWPRLLVALMGALTVPATYLLGRVVVSRTVGWVAALLALTSPVLVVLSSHYGWSNSLTPFFATVTLAAMYVGVTQRRLAILALGGFLAGLTLQTHPLSVALLAALAAWYLVQRPPREWFSRYELYVALAAFAAAYSPMIVNLVSRWANVITEVRQQTYAYAPAASSGEYLERWPHLAQVLLFTLSGTGERLWSAYRSASEVATLLQWLTVAAVVAGLIVASSRWPSLTGSGRSRTFLAFALLVPLLLFPLVTRAFFSRYLAFLIPVACVCMASAGVWIWEKAASRVMHGALAIVLAAVLGANVLAICRFQEAAVGDGTTNQAFFDLRQAMARHPQACQEGVLVEYSSAGSEDWPRETRVWAYFHVEAIRYVLAMDSCRVFVVPADRMLEELTARPAPAWLVVTQRRVRALSNVVDLHPIVAITPGPSISPELHLSLFRAQPRSVAIPPRTPDEPRRWGRREGDLTRPH